MEDGVLRITRSCAVPLHELEWRFVASGGPGGQHANRSNTKVELTFDVEASSAFGPVQRERVLRALGHSVVRIVVDDERSQLRNRDLALERLRSRLAAALVVPKDRRPTKPTKAAKQRRLDDKKRRSQIKQQRRNVD
ncbi:MAG TPA: alternative ribosome rescue aminoacyl-tRNA hydrolase ArfB [Acidimicrobiales bacterium]|nr:alternative ribosome rescue aminoacyl-tRNA hydrolase ArfB [Acidimicrobiales bacterium]